MADVAYNCGKHAVLKADMDLDEAGADMRVIFVMTNTTADTENDTITNTDDFGTLDEMDGANYARQALANQAVNRDDANDRSEFDADDVTINSLGNGTRAMEGAIVHKHVTADTDSTPLSFHDFAVNQNPGGSNFTVAWDAEGIYQLA